IGRKEDYIEPREVLRYRRNRSCQPFNWNNFLRLARRLLDLPAKYLGLYSARRNHGDHGIALLDQDSDALLPIFGSRDRCQVDERLKAPDLQSHRQLTHKICGIGTGIRDENIELLVQQANHSPLDAARLCPSLQPPNVSLQ